MKTLITLLVMKIMEDGSEDVFRYDRPKQFVIDDGPFLGPALFRAEKHGGRNNSPSDTLEALGVREYGSKTHYKVLRFMYFANGRLCDAPNCWVGMPPSHNYTNHLFIRREDNGCNEIPSDESTHFMDIVEVVLLNECTAYTASQRTADWFILRKSRITATLGGKILKRDIELRKLLNLTEPSERFMMS